MIAASRLVLLCFIGSIVAAVSCTAVNIENSDHVTVIQKQDTTPLGVDVEIDADEEDDDEGDTGGSLDDRLPDDPEQAARPGRFLLGD